MVLAVAAGECPEVAVGVLEGLVVAGGPGVAGGRGVDRVPSAAARGVDRVPSAVAAEAAVQGVARRRPTAGLRQVAHHHRAVMQPS